MNRYQQIIDELQANKGNTTLEFWQNELWQILRYHMSTTTCELTFSGHFGVPLWSVKVTYRPLSTSPAIEIYNACGVNLWKRLRDATMMLHKFFGKEVYDYER